MTGAIILTVIIVAAIYFYMRHTAKRNRAADIDSVKAYHENYKRDRSRKNIYVSDTSNTYRTYVTKYNSNEDYRERRGR